MKKNLLFAATLLTAAAAMANDGTITFKTVNNQNNMLFYASPTMPDSQKIITDIILLPEIAEMVKQEEQESGQPYDNIGSFPIWYVECITTKGDLAQGDPTAIKAGFATQSALPVNAKITTLHLPGMLTGGNSDSLMVTPYIKELPDTVTRAPYRDKVSFELDTITNKPIYGFQKLNELLGYKLGSQPGGSLLSIPFSSPYVYNGHGVDAMIYMTTMQKDIYKNLAFSFAKRKAEIEVATVYHGHNIDFQNANVYQNFAADEVYTDWDHTGTAIEIVLKHLALDKHSLPAFQFDFYTNDIRGTIKQENTAVAGKKVNLFCIEPTGKRLLGTQNTDVDGAFEFLNLDHTATYVIEVEDANIPETAATFGDKAIENDIIAEIVLQNPTGIEGVNTTKHVESVKYYNMQGIEGNTPFHGVNVVITRYNDGSKNIGKIVK